MLDAILILGIILGFVSGYLFRRLSEHRVWEELGKGFGISVGLEGSKWSRRQKAAFLRRSIVRLSVHPEIRVRAKLAAAQIHKEIELEERGL